MVDVCAISLIFFRSYPVTGACVAMLDAADQCGTARTLSPSTPDVCCQTATAIADALQHHSGP